MAFILLAISTSCETVVFFDIPLGQPKIVLNSVINPDSLIQARLTENKHTLDDNFSFTIIGNADVKLYENNLLIDVLSYQSGQYLLNNGFYPVPGNIYKIEAVATGYPNVFSEITMPEIAPLPSIIEMKEIPGEFENKLEFTLSIPDNPETNYYGLKLEVYQYEFDPFLPVPAKIDSTLFPVYIETSDPLFTQESYSYEIFLLFDDQSFSSQTGSGIVYTEFPISGNPTGIPFKQSLRISLQNLNPDYFFYLKSLFMQQRVDGDPFAEPVIVYNNIENGLGIFGAYTQAVLDTFIVLN